MTTSRYTARHRVRVAESTLTKALRYGTPVTVKLAQDELKYWTRKLELEKI